MIKYFARNCIAKWWKTLTILLDEFCDLFGMALKQTIVIHPMQADLVLWCNHKIFKKNFMQDLIFQSMPQPPASSTFTTASAVAQCFNPNSNYLYTRRSRRARSSASSSQPYPLSATSRGRSSYNRNRSVRAEPPTLKEVILLPSLSTNIVPKYAAKADLHKRGFIMDMVPIEHCWSESKIRDKTKEVFENVLHMKEDTVG